MADRDSQYNETIISRNNNSNSKGNGILGGFIEAFSQIQQYAVVERSGEEIPGDFLTLQGKIGFFNTGLSHGFWEGLLFAIATALILPTMSDPQLREVTAKYFPLLQSDVFLWMINLSPIILMGGMCCILSRYRIGIITKQAVDCLLMGRLFSMIIKGVIVFAALIMLAGKITPESAWRFSNFVALKNASVADTIYRITMNTRPNLINSAWEILGIFFIATIIPFTTVWLVSFYRRFQLYRNERFWEA